MVLWFIGMSASGKTTIGEKLFDKLSLSNDKWIFLDGDSFRNILGEDLGHTIEDRRKNAYRISRFCEFLSLQGINVVACVLSIFHDNQKYNRENIIDYREVYIDVDFDNLIKRDNKELYKKALNGEIKDVVGVDIEFKPPLNPDMIIDNNIDNPDYELIIKNIIKTFDIKIDSKYSYTSQHLLKYPHKYQYSKFEGNQFFENFYNDREICLDFLKMRLKRLEIANNYSIKLNSNHYKTTKNLILKDFLIYLYSSDDNELKKYSQIVELLIKRFEVSKKLYSTYDLKEIRKSSTEFDDLLNYPLFSLVLQSYYNYEEDERKLIYLNAILKVNDILSSIKSDFIFYDEVYYCIEAITNELKIVGKCT